MLVDAAPIAQDPTLLGRHNCRVHQRVTCNLPTTCKPASLLEMKEVSWAGTICDISVGGVRLYVERRFEKGTPLAIELPGDPGQEATTVFVKVVHVRSQGAGVWVLGCKFVSELAEDELLRLTHLSSGASSPAVSPAPGVELSPPRSSTDPLANRILSPVQFQIATQGKSIIRCVFNRFNASKCWPIVPGKILRLSGGNADRGRWSMRTRLLECKQEANRWIIQARLLHTPNIAELLRVMGAS